MTLVAVVVMLSGVGREHIHVRSSALAELGAGLHVLTEIDHHRDLSQWRAHVSAKTTGTWMQQIRQWAPLWSAMRWRGFYAGAELGLDTFDDEIDALAEQPLDLFCEYVAYAVVGRYRSQDFAALRTSPQQQDRLQAQAAAQSSTRAELAERLLRDPQAFRAELLGFLTQCWRQFFDDEWARVGPAVAEKVQLLHGRLATGSPATALTSLGPTLAYESEPPRILIDKLHHSMIRPRLTGLVIVPTVLGKPHLVTKVEPRLVPVLQVPVLEQEIGLHLARARMAALAIPQRVALCRLLAREPFTTSELALRLAMTRPQVSRHLATLRDLDLIEHDRDGRYVRYRLKVAAVRDLGHDYLQALLH